MGRRECAQGVGGPDAQLRPHDPAFWVSHGRLLVPAMIDFWYPTGMCVVRMVVSGWQGAGGAGGSRR